VSQSTRREGRNAGALACPTSRLGWRAEGYHPRDFPNTNRTTSHPFPVESIYGNGRKSATSITRRHMRPSRFVLQYLSHLISSACTSCSTVHSYAAQAASLYRYSVPGTCFSSFLRISSQRLCMFPSLFVSRRLRTISPARSQCQQQAQSLQQHSLNFPTSASVCPLPSDLHAKKNTIASRSGCWVTYPRPSAQTTKSVAR
jgi:hypothetical protein